MIRRTMLTIVVALLLAGCGGRDGTSGGPASPSPEAGLANPASQHCADKGGREDTRTDASGGQYGVCVFPNGSECESWAFYRGECSPG